MQYIENWKTVFVKHNQVRVAHIRPLERLSTIYIYVLSLHITILKMTNVSAK